MAETLEQTLTTYNIWLNRPPLAAKKCVAYRLHVHLYGAYLVQQSSTVDDSLHTPFAYNYTVRNYKMYLQTELQAKPTSVNLALAAIDHSYQFIADDQPQVQYENLPALTPHSFKREEQKALLRMAELTSSLHNRATTHLTFYIDIHFGECAAL